MSHLEAVKALEVGDLISTHCERVRQRQRIPVGIGYLTPREYQVIAMYIDGIRQGDMPNLMACRVKTIQSHLSAARHRLGAKTINQLIAMVARADAFRERDRSSNREPSTVTAPGAAPSRVL